LALIGAGLIYNFNRTGALSGRGFSDADVANVEQSIRTEFLKERGVTVVEVSMLRELPKKLTGFANIRVPLLGKVNKSCTATMGDDGKSFWRCQ
jgi:hypothetical protein